jgi:hypothetical protein
MVLLQITVMLVMEIMISEQTLLLHGLISLHKQRMVHS